MRKLLFFFLVLCSVGASAQTHKSDTLNQRFFDAKVREMVYQLHIRDDQREKFTTLYRAYSEEMIASWGEHQRPARPKTVEEAAVMQRRRMERQQRAQTVRLKYVDRLATVLDAEQLNRFFDVESRIQQRVMARRNHPKGAPRKGHPRRPTRR